MSTQELPGKQRKTGTIDGGRRLSSVFDGLLRTVEASELRESALCRPLRACLKVDASGVVRLSETQWRKYLDERYAAAKEFRERILRDSSETRGSIEEIRRDVARSVFRSESFVGIAWRQFRHQLEFFHAELPCDFWPIDDELGLLEMYGMIDGMLLNDSRVRADAEAVLALHREALKIYPEIAEQPDIQHLAGEVESILSDGAIRPPPNLS